MKTVLGIDSGGTKTLAVVLDEAGAVLSLQAGEGSDPSQSTDVEADLRRLVLALVGPELGAVEAATLGLPYFGEIEQISQTQQRVASALFGPLGRACNDVEVAHTGAFAGEFGVLCLAGTGSMAWALGPSGAARAGGFGDLIGDEGSAFRIGQQALALLSQETDGRRERSSLGAGLTQILGIPFTLAGVMEWTYGHARARAGIASVSRLVSQMAAAGDAQAADILREAGAELALTALAAANAAGLSGATPLAYAGSVLADPIVRGEIARHVGAEPVSSRLPPVGGAALDAARRAGWPIDDQWIAAVRDNLKHHGLE